MSRAVVKAQAEFISLLLVYPAGVPELEVVVAEFGKTLNDPGLIVLTDEKSIKIEHIRDLQIQLSTAPQGDLRLVVLHPAEKITLPAQQALLKLLEEPPIRTQIVLAATSQRGLLATIVSRLQIRETSSERAGQEKSSSSLWRKWDAAKTLREKVMITQEFTGKKEDIQRLLLETLRQMANEPASAKSTQFQSRIIESLEALQVNVSPGLVLEHVVLGYIL